MEIHLSPSEIEVLRKLQRNLAGSSDYVRVTCILMSCMSNSPSFVSSCLGIDVSTVYHYRSSYLHGGVEKLSAILSEMLEDAVIYYADDAHPTHNSRSTYAWIEAGERFRQATISRRDRMKINGLLNTHDVMDVIALDCESVNVESTRSLLTLRFRLCNSQTISF